MKKYHNILLFLHWVLFPPAFFIFAKRWNGMKLSARIKYSLLSPQVILLGISLSILAICIGCENYQTRNKFATKSRIEDFLGIDFPNYKEVSRTLEEDYDVYPKLPYIEKTTLKFTSDNDLDKFYRDLELVKGLSPGERGPDYQYSDWRTHRFHFRLSVYKADSTATLYYRYQFCTR